MEARDGEKSRQTAAQIAEWLAAAWNGLAYMPWPACAFVRAAHGHAQALRTWSRNDEFHEPVEDVGSSSRGRFRGRQCPHDDRRPCFSHRVSSASGVTSVRGHQRINDVTLRQWEPTTHQLSVPAPHPKLLPAPKSLTSAHEVMNQP